jgi:predicted small secreted protein
VAGGEVASNKQRLRAILMASAAAQERGANMVRRIIVSLFLLSFVSALAACGDTWRGAKKDTGENLEKTGQAIERTGDNIKP